jgi:hypothetical protein
VGASGDLGDSVGEDRFFKTPTRLIVRRRSR